MIGGATTYSGGGLWVPNNKFLRMGYKVEVWDPVKKDWNWKRIDNEEGRQMAKGMQKDAHLDIQLMNS